jgi:hypothetical protein
LECLEFANGNALGLKIFGQAYAHILKRVSDHRYQ